MPQTRLNVGIATPAALTNHKTAVITNTSASKIAGIATPNSLSESSKKLSVVKAAVIVMTPDYVLVAS